jgi:hypothetical protein
MQVSLAVFQHGGMLGQDTHESFNFLMLKMSLQTVYDEPQVASSKNFANSRQPVEVPKVLVPDC